MTPPKKKPAARRPSRARTPLGNPPVRKLRLASVIVTPVLMWDDGESLTPGPACQQQVVALDQLAATVQKFREQLPQIEAQALESAE